MKTKLPILSIVAIIHIAYSTFVYVSSGKQNDEEGWGQLALLILCGASVVAIIIDIVLYKNIKNPGTYLFIGTCLAIAGYFLFYRL